MTLAFDLEPVADRPLRQFFDGHDRLDLLHAVHRIANRQGLDVDEAEDVGVVKTLSRQRPFVEIDGLAELETQGLGQHLALRDLVAADLDALQDLLDPSLTEKVSATVSSGAMAGSISTSTSLKPCWR